jgi:EAL and modified HD-GYP domain-containing signal transduction protein
MELAQIVEADAALTCRLLVFLNSASFGMRRKVDSIKQAIVLAGWAPLNKWLKFILIADLSPTPRHQELCYYAAQRADFLKRVARAAGLERLVPTLSLLGLLSYIEAILEMPPAQALANVPVADDILHALCGQKSPLTPWLVLVQAMENADWENAEQIGKSAKLSMDDLARCYRDSFAVADALFRCLPASQSAPA